MNRTLWLIGGLGLGAGLMSLLDLDRGGHGRASARAQLAPYRQRMAAASARTAARVMNRQARGLPEPVRQPRRLYSGLRAMPLAHVGRQGRVSSLRILGYVGLGVGVMYMLDPRSGRRRRAVVRDKARSYWYRTGRALKKTSRDVRNRTRGLRRTTSQQLRRARVPNDAVLAARVLAQIGHVMAHSRALDVTAQAGRVTLSGSVPAHEMERLLATVASVAGVTEVVHHLQVQHTEGHGASPQGDQTSG